MTRQAEEIDSITAGLTEVSFTPFGQFIIFLDNGQVWRQLQGDGDRAHFNKNPKDNHVTISHGSLGSYNMTINDSDKLFKVTRIKYALACSLEGSASSGSKGFERSGFVPTPAPRQSQAPRRSFVEAGHAFADQRVRLFQQARAGERAVELDSLGRRQQLDRENGGGVGIHRRKPPRGEGRHGDEVLLVRRGGQGIDATRDAPATCSPMPAKRP